MLNNVISLHSFRRLGREFFWVGLGQGLAALGGIVGIRLLTNLLRPSSYGELALGMTAAMLVQQVVLSPISVAALRFFAPAQEANQLRPYLQGIRELLAKGTVTLLGIIGVFGIGLWAFSQTKWLELILAAFVFSLLSSYSSVLESIQNAARQRAVVAWHQGLGQCLRFLTAVVFITILGALSSSAMLGYALAAAIVLGSQMIFFRYTIFPLSSSQSVVQKDSVENWTKQMRGFAWPFATWGLFSWAQISSDRWALQAFGTTSDVGLYAVLYQIGYYPITLLSGFMVQLVSPVLFNRAGDGTDPARMNHTHRLNHILVSGSILLTAFGTVVAFLLHSQILTLLAAPEYRAVSALLPLIVLSGGLFASGQVASITLLSGLNTQDLIPPKIVTALLGVLLNFVGAHLFGVRGVVFAGVIFSLLYLAWILKIVVDHASLTAK